MDVQALSDTDLAVMLRERGVDVGPILDSTRRVYQKKLQRMINEDNGIEGSYQNEEEEEPVDEELEDYDYANADTQPVEYIPVSEPTYQRETRHSPRKSQTRNQTYNSGDSGVGSSRIAEDVLTRRTLRSTASSSSTSTTTTTSSTYQSKIQQQAEKPKKKGLSIWLQLLIFIVVAVLIFVIIQNMEPAAQDPVKGMPNV